MNQCIFRERSDAIQKLRDSAEEFAKQVASFYDALDWHPWVTATYPTEEGIALLILGLISTLESRGASDVESGGIVVNINGGEKGYTGSISFRHTAHFYGPKAVLWKGKETVKEG